MLGISKSPLPDSAPPQMGRAGERIGDEQAFISDAGRRALIRLLAVRKPAGGEEIRRAAICAVRLSGLALHLFDYARLEASRRAAGA